MIIKSLMLEKTIQPLSRPHSAICHSALALPGPGNPVSQVWFFPLQKPNALDLESFGSGIQLGSVEIVVGFLLLQNNCLCLSSAVLQCMVPTEVMTAALQNANFWLGCGVLTALPCSKQSSSASSPCLSCCTAAIPQLTVCYLIWWLTSILNALRCVSTIYRQNLFP